MQQTPFWLDFVQTHPWPIVRKPYVIAEIGLNHNGDVGIAKKLIDAAKQAGCDAVKFQKRTAELCVPPHQQPVPRETPWGTMTYMEYRHRVEFGKEQYDEIDAYCRDKEIAWFASAWDIPSWQFIRSYNTPYNKIPSAMLVHQELLITTASEGKMTFISVGMSEYEQIANAIKIFTKAKCPFILMHSISEYPAADKVLNLRQILELRERYNVPVGYSGHEESTLPSIMSVMLGAVAIERHITLDRKMWGTDQGSSLEPPGFKVMTGSIGRIPSILGTGERCITEREKQNAQKLRYFKGLVLE